MKKYFILLGMLASLTAVCAVPDGWLVAGSKPTDYEYGIDSQLARDGAASAYIKAKGNDASGFGTLMQVFVAEKYRGTRIRFSGYMKTQQAGRAQMWLRIDGPENKPLGFDNMDSRPVTGSSDWKRYDLVLDVPSNATNIAFGFFLMGGGEVWGDDFKIENVEQNVPITSAGGGVPKEPRNLSFENRSH